MSAHVLTHGVLSDSLLSTAHLTHDRKGREGKGIGIRDVVPIHRHLGDGSRPASMDGRSAASTRWQR